MGLRKPSFRDESNAKTNLSQKTFFMDSGVDVLFFGNFGSSFCDFDCPGKRFENCWIFGGVTDPESGGWQGESTYTFGLGNSLTVNGG